MIQEPIISIPVLSAGADKRKQYLTTLSLKTLPMLLSPVIQRKDQGAGLRADNLAAKKLANAWRERGEVECISPIVVAISGDWRFSPSESWPSNPQSAEMTNC